MPAGVTYVTEKHFFLVKRAVTHLTLGIIGEGTSRGGGERVCFIKEYNLSESSSINLFFLRDFSGEEFREQHLLPYNLVPITWLWSGFILPELEHL